MLAQDHPVYLSETLEIDIARRALRVRGAAAAIGGRPFEILAALAQSAGELVTKDELINRVWPGAIVGENTLQVHISALRKALGPERGVLKTASGRGYRLVGDWRTQRRSASIEAAIPSNERAFVSNLPLPESELIGRQAELERLLDLVSAYRVVTLTGPGGIGKTRLALEVARRLHSSFQEDRCLVELASISDPDLVPSAVARALGLEIDVDERSLARAIGGRRLLLLLDNCEHLVDAAAKLTEAIVRNCPGASILATSREILRIDGECGYRVPPLGLPPDDPDGQIDALQHSATRLFISRVMAFHGDYAPGEEEISSIVAICRRLDGMPLAIEFAAARAATLGTEQVLARLDDRFELLNGGRRTALPRHQTLRATLDWSYDLLPEAERRLLRRLAVFAGGFTLDAATAVAAEPDDPTTPILDGIAALVTKSLVALDGSGSAPRWRLLETVRAYLLQKLAASGESDLAASRHAAFFGALLSSPAQDAGMSRYVQEIDNVRAALDWCFAANGNPSIGATLTAAYGPIWLHLSLVTECRQRTEIALDRVESQQHPDARLKMLLEISLAASLLHSIGSEDRVVGVLERALAVAESLNDKEAQLRALWALWSYRHNGEHQIGRDLAERFLRVASDQGDSADVLVGDRLIGATLHYGGDHREARRHIERALDLYVEPTGQRHTMWFHHDQRVLLRAIQARILWMQGELTSALALSQQSLDGALRSGNRLSLCFVLGEAVCPLQILAGDIPAAERSAAMFMDVVTRHGVALWTKLAHCLDGALRIKRGDYAEGAQALRRSLESFGATHLMTRLPEFLGVLAEGLAGAGEIVDALTTVDEALSLANADGQRWFAPELLRIKGQMLLQQAEDRSPPAAEGCFLGAIEIARQQGALFWDLRASLSLAQLRLRQGRSTDAREALAAVVSRFTDEGPSADLNSARTLLAKLDCS